MESIAVSSAFAFRAVNGTVSGWLDGIELGCRRFGMEYAFYYRWHCVTGTECIIVGKNMSVQAFSTLITAKKHWSVLLKDYVICI